MSVFETAIAGLPAVMLEDEWLRVTVLAGKGADVVELTDKRRELDLTWRSPTGIRHPATIAPGAGGDDVAAFLDTYPGGWQEVLPNGGAPSVYRGATLPQHGEVATVPWDWEVVDEYTVRFMVTTRRLPLRLLKVLRLRAGVLEIDEELANESLVPLELMWGHHIAFGQPFLRPGAVIRLPERVMVIPHPTAIHPSGQRRIAPGGPYRWPVVPGTDLDTVDLSVIPEPGTPSDIAYLTGFETSAGTSWPTRAAAPGCGSSGTRPSCRTCGCGRSSVPPPTTRGGGWHTWSGWSRSPATRPTGWRRPWRTAPRCGCPPADGAGCACRPGCWRMAGNREERGPARWR